MADKVINTKVRLRYDSEANWKAKDPVLLSGEMAISSDKNGMHKVGNGTSKWSALSYAKAGLDKNDVVGALGYTPPTSNTWRPLGTTADTACAGNDSRLSNARPASDVYSWAKASSKPSYSWSEITSKPSTFTPASHTHNYAGSSSAGGAATSANKLNTNAGSSTQPVYFSNGVPVACSYTLGKSVPSNAVFTDTNTWRGVQNNLTSTATDQSLSAYQGKVLKELIDGKAASSHKHSIFDISDYDHVSVDTSEATNFVVVGVDGGLWNMNIEKMVSTSNVVNNLSSTSTTYPLSANMGKQLNTKINSIGKTARFYAAGKFYVPGSSGNYSGLAIGETAWSNIVGIQFVGASDYKHYYTFPKGTYLVNINLFANLEASTSNVLGVALNIEVDDKQIANPWFRMIDSYQSISYPVIISGSKLKVTMYSGKTIEIVNNANLSYIDFMILN